MIIFWIIFVVIILIGAAITAAIAEEAEYRQWLREIEEGNRRRKR